MTKSEAVNWAIEVTWLCAVGWHTNDVDAYDFFRLWCQDLGNQS